MAQTPQIPSYLNLPTKTPTDWPSALAYIKELVRVLQYHQNLLSLFLSGAQGADVLTNRPIAGIAGRTFYNTDAPVHFYVDNGTSWVQIV